VLLRPAAPVAVLHTGTDAGRCALELVPHTVADPCFSTAFAGRQGLQLRSTLTWHSLLECSSVWQRPWGSTSCARRLKECCTFAELLAVYLRSKT
jgi:hypothetical protein